MMKPDPPDQTAHAGDYGYDSNGNMTTRLDAGVTYTQSRDAQNRLRSVAAPVRNTAWVYDADGARVSKNDGAITTVYVGGSVESLPRRKPGSRSAALHASPPPTTSSAGRGLR